jgi:hypothetical protein
MVEAAAAKIKRRRETRRLLTWINEPPGAFR